MPLRPDGLSPVILAEVVVAVEFDQALEHGDVAAELVASFGVGHAAGAVPFADGGDAGNDVHAVAHRRIDRLEVVMLGEDRTVRFEDRRESVVAVGF